MSEWQKFFTYKEYEMRSYSETRWAAAMDALDIMWLYEPHVLKTRHGLYKPDFFLPRAKLYVEVKGLPPTQEEIQKGNDVEESTGLPVFFCHGRPELVSGVLSGGTVSYLNKNRSEITTADLGEVIEKDFGLKAYWAYVEAGRHRPRPPYTNAREIVKSYLSSMMTRGQLEDNFERQHKPLNDKKSMHSTSSRRAQAALRLLSRKLIHQ